jgi:hypothetical protein
MVSPNWPLTASASADSLLVSTPLLFFSRSYHPTSWRSRARIISTRTRYASRCPM